MTWPVVARKDFADARRSRVFWGVVGVFAVLTGTTTAAPLLLPETEPTATLGLGVAAEFAGVLVPITALVAAYLAVAGERESGSLRVLLGFPVSRRDVVVGKLLGRSAVVAVGVLAGFALAALVAVPAYGSLPVGAWAGVTALTALLGVAYVGVAVGISAATPTRARAMGVAVAVYVAFTVLWDLVPFGVHFLVEGRPPGATTPGWYDLLAGLSPSGAYSQVVGTVLGPGGGSADWRVGLAVLAAWTLVPVVAGYLQFERADLG